MEQWCISLMTVRRILSARRNKISTALGTFFFQGEECEAEGCVQLVIIMHCTRCLRNNTIGPAPRSGNYYISGTKLRVMRTRRHWISHVS